MQLCINVIWPCGHTELQEFTRLISYINENQILYDMSCLAQVTAALFALILAAYTIADTRLKNMAVNDETLLDYIVSASKHGVV